MKIIYCLTKKHEEEVESEREGETDGETHCLRERNAEESGLIEQRKRLEHSNSCNTTTEGELLLLCLLSLKQPLGQENVRRQTRTTAWLYHASQGFNLSTRLRIWHFRNHTSVGSSSVNHWGSKMGQMGLEPEERVGLEPEERGGAKTGEAGWG